VDNPPAYDFNTLPSKGESSLNQYSNAGALANSHVPSFDQVHILDNKNEISGTYYIDPSIPSLDPSRNRRKGCKGKTRKLNPPLHASFFTRHKPILLNLGITGNIASIPKANVLVSNRSGDIQVNLLPTQLSQPRIGLEAFSRRGNVVVYLPDDFQGVIHMETKRGSLIVLPVLQSRVKIANQSDRDMTLMVESRNHEANYCQETSFCHLRTRKGNVIVGLSSGDDRYVPKAGIWQWIAKRIGFLSL